MKHTPGPWKVAFGTIPGDSGFSIASDNSLAENVKITAECWPCTIVSEEHRKEIFANARLIAAAPELLKELQRQVIKNDILIARTVAAGRSIDPELAEEMANIKSIVAKAVQPQA